MFQFHCPLCIPHVDIHNSQVLLYIFICMEMIDTGLVYPMLMGTASPMPLSIMLMSFSFTCTNGALQGLSLGRDGPVYNINDVLSPISLVGIALFLFGFFANQQADHILRNLRKVMLEYLFDITHFESGDIQSPYVLSEYDVISLIVILCDNVILLCYAI